MSSAPITALASEVFQTLASYFQKDIQSVTAFLNSQNVNPNVVAFVAEAVSAADGKQYQSSGTITLNDVLSSFLPSGVEVPASWLTDQVVFTDLSFTATVNEQTKSMAFGGTVSVIAEFAGQSFPFSATFSLTSTVQAETSDTEGSLSGNLTFAQSTLAAAYEFSTESQMLTASWTNAAGSNMDMRSVVSALGQDVPQSFQNATADIADDVWNALALTQVTLTADLSDSATQVSIEAQCSLGYAFVVAERPVAGASWTLAAGGCAAATQLTDLPVIGSRLTSLPGDLDLTIAGALLVLSTGTLSGFAVPIPTGMTNPLGDFTLSVQPGVLVAAVLDFSNTSPGLAKNLASLISPPTDNSPAGQLLMTAQLPQLDLTVDLGERQLFPKLPFDTDVSLTLEPQPFLVSVDGTFTLTGGKLAGLEMTGSLDVSSTSVMGAVSADYPSGFQPDLPFLAGIWLYEIGAMMGFNCSTQEITAGLMGKFLISADAPSGSGNIDASGMTGLMPGAPTPSSTSPQVTTDEFAVVAALNLDALVPDLNLLILNLSTMSLQTLLTAMLGKNAPCVNEPFLNDLTGTNIMIYWCDAVGVMLPDGTAPTPGFRFQGAFDFWGWTAWSDIEVSLDPVAGGATGASGQFYIAPIGIGSILTIASDGNVTPPDWVVNLQKAYKFPSDGPYLSFSSSGVPAYLNASWSVTLLKWSATTVDVTVAKDSFTFTIQNQDATNFSSDIVCAASNGFTSLNMTVNGALNGTLNLPTVVGIALGDVTTGNFLDPDISVHLQGAYSAALSIDASDSNNVTMSVGGTFTIADDSRQWTLPNFTVELSKNPLTDLKDLAGILLSEISSQAGVVFQDAVVAAGSLIVKYLDKTWDDIESEADALYHDMVNTVKNFFGIHQKKRPSVPWLQDGSLVAAAGATITDPTDPNFSNGAIYRIWGLQRHFVPDMDTLTFLMNVDPKQTATFQNGDQGFAPDFVASVPRGTEMPSITYATAYFDASQTLYLSVPTNDPTYDNPGWYQIQMGLSSYQNIAMQYVSNPPLFQKTAIDDGDLNRIPKSELENPCAVTVTGGATGTEIDIFVDGARRYLPGSTGPIINWSNIKTFALPQASFNAIPKATSAHDMPTIDNGYVVQNEGNYYYVVNSQLCPVSADNYVHWALNTIPVTQVDDQAMTVLSIGHELKKDPCQ